MPPFGLRSNWPGASMLSRSSIAGDTLPPSRLAPGQFERNECIVISETPHYLRTPFHKYDHVRGQRFSAQGGIRNFRERSSRRKQAHLSSIDGDQSLPTSA